MQTRRFGSTELRMPVLSCGGMRYQQSWKDVELAEIDPKSQANLEATIHRAVELGINHIETARGYGSSEVQLGLVLPSLPRDKIIVQTKIVPTDSEDEFLRTFDQCLDLLNLDYVDLLSVHGINRADVLDQTLTRGTIDAIRRLRDDGRARHVGFSTHGPTDCILDTIKTGEFSYVNVHWYYFDQRNWPAIEEATRRDMGVFIISPSDKGGMLYAPPAKLETLCAPLTPMGFNDLFCLSHPQVHTLSIGATRPSDFDAHMAMLPLLEEAATHLDPVVRALEHEAREVLGEAWMTHWNEGLPRLEDVPGEVPLYHVLRLYTLAKAYDMTAFGKMRYNLLGSGGHWFPGCKVDQLVEDALHESMAGHPLVERIIPALREAHEMFNEEDKKRLSESE